jgi:small subunit ribosomal protein S21
VAQKPHPSGKADLALGRGFTNPEFDDIHPPLEPVFRPGKWPRSRFCERSDASVQVLVRDNNVDQALRALKKKMQREGLFREMKIRRNYEKPSERRAREKAEAVRRYRKLLRKRMEREGY